MKIIQYILGILTAFCLMIILLITSVEAVTYWTPGFYEKEYAKYGVTEDVHMEMEDLLDVTHEMMLFLRGDREDLHVMTTVNGQQREFFNQREIAHMEDVKGLFVGALVLRRICLLIAAVSVIIMFLLKGKVKDILPKTLCIGTGLFFAVLLILAGIISTDFSKYFVIFHEIFFNNDLWILDPSTDLLINIVPEPFFMDTAARIGITYGVSVIVLFLICLYFIRRSGKKLFPLFICLCLFTGLFPLTASAEPEWTENVSIEAEGGIVIDADTGAVIYGKNIHQTYFPASITKILTALIVIENCDLDETVTFSQNAVYNVESGSSNMSMETGDQMSVRDCLYGLMLQSANEVANALAEHVAGSIEEFAVMMNEKAASLGCVDSNFANPSGLNNPDHYTSAYDMALISKAAFENPTFVEVDSTTYYDIPKTKRNVEGRTIYAHHSMLKKNNALYYPGVIGGKTGYTSLAGNTLVTCAQRDGMKLISVILNGHQTHYTDTKALLDFGFENFQSLRIADYETKFASLENDMTIAGLPSSNLAAIAINKDDRITLPKSAAFSDAASDISFDITPEDPENAIAKVFYHYDSRLVGTAYLEIDRDVVSAPAPMLESATQPSSLAATEAESQPMIITPSARETGEPAATEPSSQPAKEPVSLAIPPFVWTILIVIAVLAAIIGIIMVIKAYQEKKEEQARLVRRQKRLKRFQDAGYSATEFDMILEQRRSSYTTKRKNHRHKKFPFFK